MIEFHLEDFNGPLDLLLALIIKNKMSIYDIEIVVLIDQYLEIVEVNTFSQDSVRMENASEFITMAARLVQMKSTLLLPKTDEGERMREELTGLLVEYSACKKVASELKVMAEGVFIAVREPAMVQQNLCYNQNHEAQELLRAYEIIAGKGKARRAPKAEQFDELVSAPFVSVTGRVIAVLRGLIYGEVRKLSQLFQKAKGRSEMVATFLAVLELIRAGRVEIDSNGEMNVNKKAHARKGV